MHRKTTARGAQHGVSLIETLTAITIAAILAAVAAPPLKRLLEARRLDGIATQLGADIQAARGEALARNQTLRLSLQTDADGGCWVLHSGPAGACRCNATCAADAEAVKAVRWNAGDGVSIAGNVNSIAFDPTHGTATPAGTWRVVTSEGRAVHHVINVLGRLRSCSPQAAVPGWRAC